MVEQVEVHGESQPDTHRTYTPEIYQTTDLPGQRRRQILPTEALKVPIIVYSGLGTKVVCERVHTNFGNKLVIDTGI